MMESDVGARQSSQPATLATHLEQRDARGLRREESVLTYLSDTRGPHPWEVEMRDKISKLTGSLSPAVGRESDARRGEASTSDGQTTRKRHKYLKAVAYGIPPPHLQMQT